MKKGVGQQGNSFDVVCVEELAGLPPNVTRVDVVNSLLGIDGKVDRNALATHLERDLPLSHDERW